MTTTEKMVNSILKGKNVKANKELEAILKNKVSKRFATILKLNKNK